MVRMRDLICNVIPYELIHMINHSISNVVCINVSRRRFKNTNCLFLIYFYRLAGRIVINLFQKNDARSNCGTKWLYRSMQLCLCLTFWHLV